MTITISIDPSSIRHDFSRGGVDFQFSEGKRRHRVHVPDAAIADRLRVRKLSRGDAEGFVRRIALQIALLLTGRAFARSPEGHILVDAETLRKVR